MIDINILKTEEKAVFSLRTLYSKYGYLPFKMSKFKKKGKRRASASSSSSDSRMPLLLFCSMGKDMLLTGPHLSMLRERSES